MRKRMIQAMSLVGLAILWVFPPTAINTDSRIETLAVAIGTILILPSIYSVWHWAVVRLFGTDDWRHQE